MVKADPSLSLRTGSLDLPKADMGAITKRFSPAMWADPDVVPYAARVSVWGRWFVVLVGAFEIAYRPGFWYPDNVGAVLLMVPLVTLNGSVHFRLLTNRPVTWRWMLLLSAMDIALATASIAIGPGFDSFVFVAYYPALALFVVVFTSLWLGLAWTTMTAAAYALVCWMAGAGLDIDAGDEKVLVGRLAAMYALVLCVSLITGFERIRRQTAVNRERQVHGNASSSPRRSTTRPRRPPTWSPLGFTGPENWLASQTRSWRPLWTRPRSCHGQPCGR